MDASTQALPRTERTRLHRHSERARTSRADLYAVLDAGMICHLGVVIDGTPVVLPTAYGRIGDTLYLHGSSANRSLHAADGTEVCVTVTHIDGLVCARSVFSHSVNYRCAMVFGTAPPFKSNVDSCLPTCPSLPVTVKLRPSRSSRTIRTPVILVDPSA